MEEDIKILEERIKSIKNYDTYRYDWIETDIQLVENLIKGYKREKEDNERWEKHCNGLEEQITGLNNKIFELEHNSIPKSKVKEKIEELDKQEDALKERIQKNKSLPLFEHNELLYCIPYTRSYLQELMEDK